MLWTNKSVRCKANWSTNTQTKMLKFDLEAWKLFLPHQKKKEIIARWFIQCTGYKIPNGQQYSYTHHTNVDHESKTAVIRSWHNRGGTPSRLKSWKFAGPYYQEPGKFTVLLISSYRETISSARGCRWSFYELIVPFRNTIASSDDSRHSNNWFDLPLITDKLESVPSLLLTLLELVYPR